MRLQSYNFNPICSLRVFYKEVFVDYFKMVETSLNIDLNDPRAAKIADVLSNKTCKKIISALSEEELTETDLAKKLKIPLNTVDYNVKKLVSAGLIESTSHFWSVKGKKIPSYKLANKKIIISPKSLALQKYSFFGLLGVGAAYAFYKYVELKNTFTASEELAFKSGEVASLAADSSNVVFQETASVAPTFLSSLSNLDWILISIWLAAVLFMGYNYISMKGITRSTSSYDLNKSNTKTKLSSGGKRNNEK